MEHKVDYSLVGMPQLPTGLYWYYHEGYGLNTRTIRVTSNFEVRIRSRKDSQLTIVRGNVQRNGYSGDSTPLASVFVGHRPSIKRVRRAASRLAKKRVAVSETGELYLTDPPKVKRVLSIDEVIGPIAAYQTTLEVRGDWQ